MNAHEPCRHISSAPKRRQMLFLVETEINESFRQEKKYSKMTSTIWTLLRFMESDFTTSILLYIPDSMPREKLLVFENDQTFDCSPCLNCGI